MYKNINKLLKDVRDLIIPFDEIPLSAWDNDEFADQILGLYPRGYTYVEKRKNFDNKELIEYINKTKAPGIYKYLPLDAKKDEDIIYQVIPWCIEDVPKYYLKEDKFLKRILSESPLKLGQLSKEIRNNKEYVKLAVKYDGLALIHASSVLRSDIELILIALVYSKDTNTIIIDHLGKEIKNDLKLLLNLISELKLCDEYFEETLESIFNVLKPSISKLLKENLNIT